MDTYIWKTVEEWRLFCEHGRTVYVPEYVVQPPSEAPDTLDTHEQRQLRERRSCRAARGMSPQLQDEPSTPKRARAQTGGDEDAHAQQHPPGPGTRATGPEPTLEQLLETLTPNTFSLDCPLLGQGLLLEPELGSDGLQTLSLGSFPDLVFMPSPESSWPLGDLFQGACDLPPSPLPAFPEQAHGTLQFAALSPEVVEALGSALPATATPHHQPPVFVEAHAGTAEATLHLQPPAVMEAPACTAAGAATPHHQPPPIAARFRLAVPMVRPVLGQQYAVLPAVQQGAVSDAEWPRARLTVPQVQTTPQLAVQAVIEAV